MHFAQNTVLLEILIAEDGLLPLPPPLHIKETVVFWFYAVLVSVSCPKALFNLEYDNHFSEYDNHNCVD